MFLRSFIQKKKDNITLQFTLACFARIIFAVHASIAFWRGKLADLSYDKLDWNWSVGPAGPVPIITVIG